MKEVKQQLKDLNEKVEALNTELKQKNKQSKETSNERVEASNTEMNNFRTASINQIRAIYMKFSSPSLKLNILSIIVCLFAMNTLWTLWTKSSAEQSETPLQESTHKMVKALYMKNYFSNITPAFNGHNKEDDIVFPEPVEARFITFKPKTWNLYPYIRCDVYVDGVLQTTPLSQRTASSYHSDNHKDSTMRNPQLGWLQYGRPFNANEWLKLDLQQCKNITGIRVELLNILPTNTP